MALTFQLVSDRRSIVRTVATSSPVFVVVVLLFALTLSIFPTAALAQSNDGSVVDGEPSDANAQADPSSTLDGVTVPSESTEPSTSTPSSETSVPATTHPATTQPVTTQPVTTQPVTTQSETTELVTSVSAEPSVPGDQTSENSMVEGQDQMVEEPPGEEAPQTDETVPPKGSYAGQGGYRAPGVLWSSVVEADKKLETTKAARIEVIARVRVLRIRHKELQGQQGQLDGETQASIAELAEATDRLRSRAVTGFQRNSSGNISQPAPSDYRDTINLQRRTKMVAAALVVDRASIDQLGDLRAALNTEAIQMVDRIKTVSDSMTEAEAELDELDSMAEQALIEYEAFKAGSELFIDGVVYPIAGPASAPFDSFGFPRMPGTPDEHWHEGIDLFAPKGTPLVATERGVITRLGVGRLGGLKFWIKGESGSEWYYAHLDSFAPGLVDGLIVEAGQLVGYVGNTGNAITTPPHLHMELHPNGGRAVNPFPLLKVVYDLDRAAEAAGNHPGYTYKLFVAARAEQAVAPVSTLDSAVSSTSVPAAVVAAGPEPTVVAQPSATSHPAPVEAQPAVEPAAVEPVAVEPVAVEPVAVEPAPATAVPSDGQAVRAQSEEG